MLLFPNLGMAITNVVDVVFIALPVILLLGKEYLGEEKIREYELD